MARAIEIAGLTYDEPYRQAAARVVGVRAHELFAEAEGVLDVDDIDRVHDMRVATRRLRAVLEIFEPCFPHKAFGNVLRDVKALADVLGERRDPDVHIESLDAYAAVAAQTDRAGIESLVQRFRDQQSDANASLGAALDEMERSDLRGRLEALVEAAA